MKRDKRLLCLIIWIGLFLITPDIRAQEIDQVLQSIINNDQFREEEVKDETVDVTVFHEREEELKNNPVDLSVLDPVEILRLEMLERKKMDALYEYLLLYGPMMSVYELQAVEGIDGETVSSLIQYVTVSHKDRNRPLSLKELFRKPHVELMTSVRRVLQQKSGYDPDTGMSVSSCYMGDPWQEKMTLRVNFSNHLLLGVALKKDPGEIAPDRIHPFRFDDRSAFLAVKDMGWLKRLVIGNFGASFGQGLTLGGGNGSFSGPQGDFGFRPGGITPTLSTRKESTYRGIGVICDIGNTVVSGFLSMQNRDAGIDSPEASTGDAVISSLTEGGYHRTLTETEKKDAVKEYHAGLNFRGGGEHWKSGFTLFHHTLEARLLPGPQPYNKFRDTSSRQTWAGWDFQVFLPRFTWSGEISSKANGGNAMVSNLSLRPSSNVAFSFSLRMLQGKWSNSQSASYLVTSSIMNEVTLAGMMQLLLHKNWDMTFSTEASQYPWLRYQVSAPSSKIKHHLKVCFRPSKTTSMEGFMKWSEDQKDRTDKTKTGSVCFIEQITTGIQVNSAVERLTLKGNLRWLMNREAGVITGSGFLMAQDVSWWIKEKKARVTFRVALFDTDSYNERIYCWDQDLYQSFSVPAYYSKGYQTSMVFSYHWFRGLDSWIKYSRFSYPGMVVIGSGTEQISGNQKSELAVQIRISVN
ncbi:MAG: hypothetical protein NTU44_19265 [Bacteroidetes bacterium]|nr:hypothetical protein [Bacteroidota bacterium]